MKTPLRTVLATAALAGIFGCQPNPAEYGAIAGDPELLHGAVDQVTEAMMSSITSPPVASRTYAYASIAAYEAMRPGNAEYRSLAGQLPGLEPPPQPDSTGAIDFSLAGVNALLTVAEALVFAPERVATHREVLADSLRRLGIPGSLLDRSFAYGATVGRHVLAWAGTDGIKAARASARLEVHAEPGRWMPTPPAYMDAVEANWGSVRPFVLATGSEIPPAPPAPFDAERDSPFQAQVMDVYETSRTLTPEQREIAAFWDCNPFVVQSRGHLMSSTKKISPGGHWMGITAIAARRSNLDMMRSAEAYTRVSIALADGFIGAWDEKYRSIRVRPVTIIQDEIDRSWQPLLQTPPFPEYPSGHSVISAAAAEVLTDLFGDDFAFVDSTEVRFGIPARSFASFRQAAEEAAISRLYGGIHFRDAIDAGLTQGRRIGGLVLERVETRPATLVSRR